METLWAWRPALAVGVSLLAALLVLATRRPRGLREAWTFLAALAKLVICCTLVPDVLAGNAPEVRILPIALGIDGEAPRLALHLRVDALGLVFALVASSLWLVTSLFSVGYVRAEAKAHQTGYFAAFALCLGSAVGIAFAANLITFFIFYEMLAFGAYPLVVHDRDEEARAAGRKYLAYAFVAGAVLLVAVIWTEVLAPGATFEPGGFLAGTASPTALRVLLGLFLVGVGVKAAVMPLHAWLPAAMVAPTPVSALLHAVAVVKAGVFGCLRVMGWVYGPELLSDLGAAVPLAVVASVTIIGASLLALVQQNLKKRLAYSTVSQLSYIVGAGALGTALAYRGAIFHIAAHGFMKITLFFCAGAIYVRTHEKEIPDMHGIGRKMPVTLAAFAVASLGMAGTPFVAGFVSKWSMALGALDAGQVFFVGVLVASGLLNVAYFLPIVYRAYFLEPEGSGERREAPWAVLVPLCLTAAGALVLGVVPDVGLRLWELAGRAGEAVGWSPPGGGMP